MQTFFVNNRPVKSKLLTAALEEAYRNQIMVGKFPGCVLHLTIPAGTVDVNVHPAKTEVKFLNEKAVFDCIHYGVLGTLNKTQDRPSIQFSRNQEPEETEAPSQTVPAAPSQAASAAIPRKTDFYRTMNAQEYKAFTGASSAPIRPRQEAAAATLQKVQQEMPQVLHQNVMVPQEHGDTLTIKLPPRDPVPQTAESPIPEPVPETPPEMKPVFVQADDWDAEPAQPEAPAPAEDTEQISLPMPEVTPWRLVGELYRTYIIVEQGDEAFLIDKHAAHERINFERLKANQEKISGQALLSPIPVRLSPAECGELLSNGEMLEELGFQIEEFGENTLLLRQIPMDLSPDQAAETLDALADDLLRGRREHSDTVRDDLLHTVACKAAIKAGWVTDERELYALCKQVMEREDLKYCPHGRPICVSLSKHLLEKQFKRIV